MKAKKVHENFENILKPKNKKEIDEEHPGWYSAFSFIQQANKELNKRFPNLEDFINIGYENGPFIWVGFQYIIELEDDGQWALKVNMRNAKPLYIGPLDDNMIKKILEVLNTGGFKTQ